MRLPSFASFKLADLPVWLKAHWRGVLLGLAGLGAALVVLILVAGVLLYPQLPDTSALSNYQPKQPLRVYTADGVEIGGFGSERRVYQRIDQIPQLMKDSLLAVEDSRFYSHHGIDPIGIVRALGSIFSGGRIQGASTITQQVARTFFLNRSRSLDRKFKEALLSLKIESQLSKDQVLELYMNQIYLGSRAYGFEAAAQTYFGKTLSALNPAECAMLAGLPQNPYFVNPIRNFERARARQLVALSRMRSQGVIDEDQYQAAKAQKLSIRRLNEVDVHAEYVAEMARQQVYAQYGELSYTTGLRVTTTLRAADQEAAYKALRRTLIERELRQPWRGPEGEEKLAADLDDQDPAVAQALSDFDDDEELRVAIVTQASPKAVTVVLASGEVLHLDGAALRQVQPGLAANAPNKLRVRRGAVLRALQQGKNWVLTQWPEAEGALVSLDPHNGEVRALVGGFDFHRNQFNHVTQGWRQPGSSYKPFIYSGAIENGVQPETVINDAPLTNVGDWDPQNDDGSTDGPISLRTALARSKNLVSIRLLQLLGPNAAREWTSRFGFDPERQPDNLTQALGSGSTNPLQLATAYGVLANGGYRLKPQWIRRITDAQGQTVFEAPEQSLADAERVVPARNTFLVASLLQDVTRVGTAARAQATLKRPDLYGKTGTTNDVVDAWFAGFQPGLVAVVWVGHDTPKSLGSRSSGSALALPAWIDYMSTALRHVPVQELQAPEGVVRAEGDWRYAEWADGSFIRSLGLDGQVISPALALHPAQAEPPAPAAETAAPAASK
ncbi:PBP1A family penicillin-binding protein [Curvibacter sp. RS43]|uniref:penicillin-binding protein 1A n=1 Tax=Curvibacter microcysteis TaxID=3026419 RepID=UPI0023600BFF|nr:PBP1A family penicillin-binding protein [Curvibacter sp. RS43]MDD0812153.1 PBP1A family penicillin-binding protein [Curvibacter sp. RS43]